MCTCVLKSIQSIQVIFLEKPYCAMQLAKNVWNLPNKQCSKTFDITGLIPMPLKSLQVSSLDRQSFILGTGTILLYRKPDGIHILRRISSGNYEVQMIKQCRSLCICRLMFRPMCERVVCLRAGLSKLGSLAKFGCKAGSGLPGSHAFCFIVVVLMLLYKYGK